MDRLVVILHVAFCVTVLVAQTCSSKESWGPRKVLYRSKRQATCIYSQFRCTSGACIDIYNVCDGTKECSDGSDETEKICKQLNIKCPSSAFQCAYGACIDGDKKCNGLVECADESDESGPQCTTPESSNCKAHEFKCKSGQCIDAFAVCDGKVNCGDGSDETSEQCSSIVCPKFTFRCAYGACIDVILRCNCEKDCADNSDEDPKACNYRCNNTTTTTTTTSEPTTIPRGRCVLPKQPESGSYTSPVCERGSTPCKDVPGSYVPENWLLSFKCNDGYYISGSRFEDPVFLYCVNGNWSNEIPVCKPMCPPLISLSVEVTCKYQGDIIDCSKSMRPGTLAKGNCKPWYTQIRPPPYREIICNRNGYWSYELFRCHPDCGKRNFKGINTPLIIDGIPTKHGEFPWHTGLYMKNDSNRWEQKCGGSLISPHIVLTAAHCVFSETTKKVLSPADVKVGLGKYYREWTIEEKNAEKSDVREIAIPTRYLGQSTSFAQDIALLDLTHSIQITANIMPVCVDWELQFTITPGMMGTLPGWGGTENASSSDVLLYAELPYIDYTRCISDVSPMFQHYVTIDKFCAGVPESSRAARGDSGGGLTFVFNNVHYVFGIVSTSVKGDKTITTFTNISNSDLHAWFSFTNRKFDEAHVEI